MAKALVRIKGGKIDVLTDPQIKRCPLRKDIYGFEEESRETIRKALEGHVRDLGMYGPGRVLELEEKPVSFGASEILTDAMAEGLVDAAVVVCEGAGTVVVTRPEVLQAVGAHMVGLLRTEPIPEVQAGLEARGCLLLGEGDGRGGTDERKERDGKDKECLIDQIAGYQKAVLSGFRKIAVTVAGVRDFEAKKLRELGKASGVRPFILAVHTTGVTSEQAGVLADCCDLVWSCASRAVREVVGKRSRMQIGIAIPVFALTLEGKRLILNRALHFQDQLVLHRGHLPLAPEGKQPEPLI